MFLLSNFCGLGKINFTFKYHCNTQSYFPIPREVGLWLWIHSPAQKVSFHRDLPGYSKGFCPRRTKYGLDKGTGSFGKGLVLAGPSVSAAATEPCLTRNREGEQLS